MGKVVGVYADIEPLRKELREHEIYWNMSTINDVQLFMEYHVFEVWSYMSLLKVLQNKVSFKRVPWIPSDNAKLSYCMNQIMINDEVELNRNGKYESRFETYLTAMREVGASTKSILVMIESLRSGYLFTGAFEKNGIDDSIKDYLNQSMELAYSDQLHKMAAFYVFGREPLRPNFFIEVLNLSETFENQYSAFRHYLNRSFELESTFRRRLGEQLIVELCANDEKKWEEVLETAKISLRNRIQLWNSLSDRLNMSNPGSLLAASE